jgi:hypothetical protein
MEGLGAGAAIAGSDANQQKDGKTLFHAAHRCEQTAPLQQGFDMGIASAKGAIGGGEIAGATRGIDEFVQPVAVAGSKGSCASLKALKPSASKTSDQR